MDAKYNSPLSDQYPVCSSASVNFSQPAAPSEYTTHDAFWYGIPPWPAWVTCTGSAPSQLLGQCPENWKVLDLSTIKSTKYSTVLVTRKKMNSIPNETRTSVETAWRCNWRYCFLTMEMDMSFPLEVVCFGASGEQCEVNKAPLFWFVWTMDLLSFRGLMEDLQRVGSEHAENGCLTVHF